MADYLKPRSMFHFNKSQPAETHLLVESWNAGLTANALVDNITAIPSAGEFVTTAIHTEATPLNTGRMSDAPDGCVAYCNGNAAHIWGGTEARCVGFVLEDSTGATHYDYTLQVSNTLTDALNVATLSIATSYVYVASTRPIKGVKFYVGHANASAATVAISEWSSSTWTSLTLSTDGTVVTAGKTLGQTGTISFPTTVSTAKVKVFNDTYAYWYRFIFTGIDTDTTIYYTTVDAPMQNVVDIWDGEERTISSFWVYLAAHPYYNGWFDRTTNVLKVDYVTGATFTYTGLGLQNSSCYIMAGFQERLTGMKFVFGSPSAADVATETGTNTEAAVATVYYWNGTAWTTVGTISDGTSVGGISFNRNGWITWDAPASSSEFKYTLNANGEAFYYYKVVFNATFSSYVYIDYISGIPAQKKINPYSFPVKWQNRLWLLDEYNGKRNSAICTSQDTVCVFNGADAISPEAPMEFGNNDKLVGGATLYTRFGANIYENLIIFKKAEMWIVDGEGPEKYIKYKVGGSYGLAAIGTLKSCDLGFEIAPGIFKHVLIWQSDNAVLVFDGNTVSSISDDIKNYFDRNKTEFIPDASIHKSEAFYDEATHEYHWLFASGSGQSTLNKEFVYDIMKKRWYQVDRGTGNYLQVGCLVHDTNGKAYSFGGIDTGYIERLEYGNTFDGTDITSTFRNGDMALGGWQYLSEVRHIKHIVLAKSTTTNSVTITHFGDGNLTGTTETITHAVKSSTYKDLQGRGSVKWGNYTFHSFQCSIVTSNESCAYEPIGLEIRWRPLHEDTFSNI